MGTIVENFTNVLLGNFATPDFRALATKAVLPLLSAVALAGCSTHPVQQDVTGLRTVNIVNHLRCETRLGIQDTAITLLIGENGGVTTPFIGELIATRGDIWNFDPARKLNRKEQDFYYRYILTGIAYDFSFDVTEENGAGFSADPIRLITGGTAGVALGASGDFRRNNLRHFIVSETFQDLLLNKELKCSPEYLSPNFVYPIAGSIGLKELISTFVELNEVKRLAVDKASSKVFADTLTFTTTVSGSATPHVIVAPVGNRWGLASPATIGGSASRVDKHMLIVGLSQDTPKGGAVRRAGYGPAVLGLAQPRSALQKSGVVSAAEQSALDAVSQARLDAYLDRATR
jgi:hypothetical protein